jgi:methyl-accepting chemotaxis protein
MTTSSKPPSNYPSTYPGGSRYKRSVRNLLLDSRFQLKYTGFLVAVVIVVSGVLGAFLYRASNEVIDESRRVVEESKKVSDVVKMSIKDDPIYGQNPELAAAFTQASTDRDAQIEEQAKSLARQQRTMLFAVVGSFAALVVIVGCFGIWFTHKVAGPIYKIKMLLRQVGDGKLVFHGRLRKGDELQDFFEAFATMVDKLRDRQAKEVEQLDAALRMAGQAGVNQESLSRISAVRDEMRRALDE